jgi:hypothetical protein
MKVEYGVNLPRNQYGKGKYATIFWKFYDGEHKTAKFSLQTKEEANKLYKSAQNIISRNCMLDIRAMIVENEVYFEKYSVEE